MSISSIIDFSGYWKTRIISDLSPFCDPGTELKIEGEGRSLRASWLSRGNEKNAQFSLSIDQGVQVTFSGMQQSYRSFLVGPEMADLLGLSKMILQSQKQQLFIPTKASFIEAANELSEPAVELLQRELTQNDSSATKIIMVTGEAGAGKTRVLQELVRKQAALYQQNQSTTLYLYINAQGRALARFNEALATELQDLRALLTYHAVAALVRIGALVPVIDGFDELLGLSGYDDAFSSLSRFIEELDGQGQVVASARSTYYEEEFVSRASISSSLGGQVWKQIPIQIRAWGEDEFLSYIKSRLANETIYNKSETELISHVQRVFSGSNKGLKHKPLFVARAVDLILNGVELQGEGDLLSELVTAFLERERKEKLLDKNEAPLLTSDQISTLMASLAEEMWDQETRELDRRSVREVAEYVLVVEGVEESIQSIVIERMPTLAFLSPGERAGSVGFEHELFFSYFLSQVFSREICRYGSSVELLLSRSILPSDVAHITIRQISTKLCLGNMENLITILEKLAQAGSKEGLRTSQIRENAGRIVLEALLYTYESAGSIVGIALKNLIFPGGTFQALFENITIDNVIFRRTDLSRTIIKQSKAKNVLFQEITVDPNYTKIELSGLDATSQVYGLRLWEDGIHKTIYDPKEVAEVLASCGAISINEADIPIYKVNNVQKKLIEKLLRSYRKANPICKADENLRSLFTNPEWQSIETILLEHRIVTLETKQTGGKNKEFLRRQFLPEQIMAGMRKDSTAPRQIKNFWAALEKL